MCEVNYIVIEKDFVIAVYLNYLCICIICTKNFGHQNSAKNLSLV